ncbi:O-methyltransferase family 3 protein [Stereum hirsutum FP-91666 SS1]|uniref:O-methyltransferase family 3 protein n=1 Tax=Stereum hirsutum (strain FP-91666) TaxID=721885 RepID=UPI000440E727|nr:O-methyltransferase family 3 protein [Stereum hirsutum FP-91666 SS1]EIM88286.1 O-methyltransferase family 3 protein [Stereum hirsutum FP-91666 SS1]
MSVGFGDLPATTYADWCRSDEYHNSFLIPRDEAVEAAMKNSAASGLLDIEVSRSHGKFLHLLARTINAKRVLEVGTLGGFSATCFARAVPEDGQVVTCELEPKHAKVAEENLKLAGVDSKVKILVGPARDTLPALQPDEPFDMAFIDADKVNNVYYFIEAKRMVRKGGIIIVDNVVRNGTVSIPTNVEEPNLGVRKLLAYLKEDKEVEATTVGTAGQKGYDGFLYALKL